MLRDMLLRFVCAMMLCGSMCGVAMGQQQVRFRNEAQDTTAITDMLMDAWNQRLRGGDLVMYLAERFVGRPYVAATLEGVPEMLTVNIDEFDCTTFVETVLAMAMTVDEGRTSWRDFVYNLRRLRYRGGEVNGYGSRLHYFSDWVVENTHRGAVREVTDRVANAAYVVKTLDFMSSHADKYAALGDAQNLADIKNAEIGYRMHRFPIIKLNNIGGAMLKDGDVVAIATTLKGLDVTHMGFVKMVGGVAHLLHASSREGKVVVDALPLADYVRRNRQATGIRVVRRQ